MGANTQRLQIPIQSVTGGLNDTSNRNMRSQSEAQTLTNFRLTPDGILKKVNGRQLKTGTFASTITGLIVPPKTFYLCTLDSAHNTLAYKYGSAAVATISLSTGHYATHAALATELASKLNAAITPSKPILVTYSTSTRKFTITNGASTGNSDLILCWHYSTTTVDPSLFGFRWSVLIEDGTAAAQSSEFVCSYEVPVKMLIPTTGKLYDEDKIEITYPDGASVESIANDWSGYWDGSRWYGVNGDKNFILRDSKYIRHIPDITGVFDNQYRYVNIDTSTGNRTLYDVSSGTTEEIAIGNTNKGVRLPLTAGISYLHLVNHIIISCKKENANDQFKIGVYITSQDRNGSVETEPEYHFVRYITGADVTTSQADFEIDIPSKDTPMPCPPIYASGQTGTAYLYLVLESEGTGTLQLYSKAEAGTYDVLDANGCWTTVSGSTHIRATVEVEAKAGNGGAKKYTNIRCSLVNSENFETELSDLLLYEASTNPGFISARLDFVSIQRMDVKYLNIYRTKCDGTNYYLVAQIPVNQFYAQTNLTWYDGVSDANLEYLSEGDMILTRTPMPAFEKLIKFDNRAWGLGKQDAPEVAYYSYSGRPEQFDLAQEYVAAPIDIMDGAAISDRLIIITKNNVGYIYNAGGEAYGYGEMSQGGIGTQSKNSAVGVVESVGPGVYYQGSDGHFYYTDGLSLKRISEGKLETLIATIALDKTRGFYDSVNKEIRWQICTGAYTVPNTCLIYSLVWKHWKMDSINVAKYTELDNITATAAKLITAGGYNHTTDLYWLEGTASDFTATAITATFKSADWHFGVPLEEKTVDYIILQARSQVAGQQVTVNWYENGSSTATATTTLTLTTSWVPYRLSVAKKCRLFSLQLVNADYTGWVQFYPDFAEIHSLTDLRAAAL